MLTKKELKTRIYEAFNEQLSAEGFKFRKRDETFLRKEDDDTCFHITLFLKQEAARILFHKLYLIHSYSAN